MNRVNRRGIIICSFFIILLTAIMTGDFLDSEEYEKPSSIYQVYLDGEKVGLIKSKDKLYEMINKEQTAIKKQYNVKNVYPPKGFEIVKLNTYNDNYSSIESVYNTIKKEKD